MGKYVRVEEAGPVATVRLLRPTISGADPVLPAELAEAAERVGSDPAVRAVILTGGRRVFGSGADLAAMAECTPAEVDAYTARLHAGFAAIAAIPKPVVAAIVGFALGGGLELALCADFRVAGSGAVLGLPEIRLGIIPGTGGTQRLPRLIGPARAKRLIMTGRQVDAAEALELGLVDEVVPDTEVHASAQRLAERFADGPTAALGAAKRAVDEGLGRPLAEGLDLERHRFAALFATADQREGLRAHLAGEPPRFIGH
ncbi:enoyl-CoA hydratase/isomerase family protein [Kitasatospora sp. NPDC086009]|uniref:enoyl-CoA hydratase/isomerase family protein n=1 Tax=unclassified Kitasatospora TaxID=2633591 RepID=UPI0037CA9F05